MFPLNTIIAWSINIIMNKKYDNNNIIIASRAYFLQKPLQPRGKVSLILIETYTKYFYFVVNNLDHIVTKYKLIIR
jgi:hypothetical protein